LDRESTAEHKPFWPPGYLGAKKHHGFRVLTEQRVKVSPTRVRIPDVCLVSASNNDELTQRPPLLWIEVVSPDDRWSRIQTRLAECTTFGVPMIWIVDPYTKQAWTITGAAGAAPVTDGILRYPELGLEVPLEEILTED
jgi:Uma2 family endonuclease